MFPLPLDEVIGALLRLRGVMQPSFVVALAALPGVEIDIEDDADDDDDEEADADMSDRESTKEKSQKTERDRVRAPRRVWLRVTK